MMIMAKPLTLMFLIGAFLSGQMVVWASERARTLDAPAQVVGHWEGTITRSGKDWRIQLDIRADGGELKGAMDLPDYGYYVLPVKVQAEVSKIRISYADRSSTASLEGDLQGETMSGRWQGLDVEATFQIKRTRPQPVIDYLEEEVRFQNGEAVLVGTLIKPAKPGRHPAIIFTHGSGNQTRTQTFYRSRAYLFARHGIAALIYDRRGKGESKGGGENATWVNLADDALAGLRALQARPDINPRQIGVSGFSQGGWVSPLAASRSKDVAFVLLGSAPAVTPDAQNDYNVESLLRLRKVPADRIAAVMLLRKRVAHFQHTGEGDKTSIEAQINQLRGEPWFQVTLMPEKLEPYDAESKAYISFNPAPLWERITVPVLSLWGAQDAAVPAALSKEIMERALKQAGNRDYTLKIFPKSGHGVGVISEEGEPWDWPRLAPGYEQTMVEWARQRVTMSR